MDASMPTRDVDTDPQSAEVPALPESNSQSLLSSVPDSPGSSVRTSVNFDFDTPVLSKAPTDAAEQVTPAPVGTEAGTGETRSAEQGDDGPLVYVRDGYMYVCGKVGKVFVNIKVKLESTYDKTKCTAMESYALVLQALSKYGVKAQGQVVLVKGALAEYGAKVQGSALLIKGKVVDGVMKIKMKAVQGRELVVTRAASGFELVKTKTLAEYELVRTKTSAGYQLVKAKTSAGYELMLTKVYALPVPAPIKNGYIYVQGKAGNLAVCLKGNAMYVYGRVGDAIVSVKVNGIATYDRAAAKAQDVFAGVVAKIEPYTSKASGGFMAVKGKVDGYVIQVRAKGAAGMKSATDRLRSTYELVKKEVVDKVTLVQDKVNSGVTIVSAKVQDTAVYIKDGYMHIVTKAQDKTVYIRARITTVQGTVKVKAFEAYVRAETLTFSIVDYLAKLLEDAKVRADYQPVGAGAVGGAVIVGAGSAAAGGLAGGIAGATLGLPMALFTFGLSIPVMGIVGGGAGAAGGAILGGAAGAVGGGATGYGYQHRAEIKSGMDGALVKASDYKDKATTAAKSQLAKVRGKVLKVE